MASLKRSVSALASWEEVEEEDEEEEEEEEESGSLPPSWSGGGGGCRAGSRLPDWLITHCMRSSR
jgi:hypothetical protein